jgi:(4-(4-[2-(gamma-L-glutamylamino)ethyl]phenoxymethyl)furan-2-yl)methanamine synthase
MNIIGWDIGAVNVKAAWLGEQVRVASQPLEIWRDKGQLPKVLQTVYKSIASGAPEAMAVTMTAELSDAFDTKREGVLSVLECFHSCFPETASYCLNLAGEFVSLVEAQNRPLEFAAANWLASALWIAKKYPDCLLLDVGSTTSDIIPILDSQVCISERTDTARLSSGELVYTGVLRTNLAAIVQSAPVAGRLTRVASEYFAISGDVHLILGNIQSHDYTCPTPDGRPPSIDSARKRLARLVCADDEMLSTTEIDKLARYICAQQVRQIQEGIKQILARLPKLRTEPVIVLGAGAFLGRAAAEGLGLKINRLADDWHRDALVVAPCLSVGRLLAEHLQSQL